MLGAPGFRRITAALLLAMAAAIVVSLLAF
jgi:hypothetical protein